MPVETILFPSGDGTGDFIAVGGPSAKWKTVNSGIVAPFDSTYLRASGVQVDQAGGMTQFLGLEDPPKYFNTIDTISGIVRLRVHNQEDDYSLDLQFFEGDSTTPLTYPSGKSHSDGGVFQSSEGAFQDHVFNFDISGGAANRPCAWEDALLKMTVTCEEIDSPLDISEIHIGLYHTSGTDCCNCTPSSGCCCYWDGSNHQSVDWSTEADCLSRQPRGYFFPGSTCGSVDCDVVEPPASTKWSCINPESTESDRCIEDAGGTYSSQSACLSACVPSWNCVVGACLEDPDGGGTYSSLSECEDDCWYYKCDLATETCTQAADGTYATAELCAASCTTTTTTTTAEPPAGDCCDWDGHGYLQATGICDFTIDMQFTEGPDNTWSFGGTTSCGDPFDFSFSCDPTKDVGPDKWTLINFDLPCATDITYNGQTPTGCAFLDPPLGPGDGCTLPWECDEAPFFWFEIGNFDDCLCCDFSQGCLISVDADSSSFDGYNTNITPGCTPVGVTPDHLTDWCDPIIYPCLCTDDTRFISDNSTDRFNFTFEKPAEDFEGTSASGYVRIRSKVIHLTDTPGSVSCQMSFDVPGSDPIYDIAAVEGEVDDICNTDGYTDVSVPFTIDTALSRDEWEGFRVNSLIMNVVSFYRYNISAISLFVKTPAGNPPTSNVGACCTEILGICECENELTEAECQARPSATTEWFEGISCNAVNCYCDE